MATNETNKMLAAAAAACEDKKAEDIRILALDPAESGLTDYFLLCNGTNERQNVAIADEIEIELWKDDTTRTVDVPAEFLQALRASGALGQFENLSYTHRKEYCRLTNEAKTEQTRTRRVQNAVEQVTNKQRPPDEARRKRP